MGRASFPFKGGRERPFLESLEPNLPRRLDSGPNEKSSGPLIGKGERGKKGKGCGRT